MANPLKMLKLKAHGFQFIQELSIDAPPAAVWKALLNARVWFRFRELPDHPPMTLEPRVGGMMIAQGEKLAMYHGMVAHLEPGKLLRINGPMGMTHLPVMNAMIWELQPAKGGRGTKLRFCHRSFGYMRIETKRNFQGGWKKLLPQIRALAEKRMITTKSRRARS